MRIHKYTLGLLFLILGTTVLSAQPNLDLINFSSGFDRPVDIENAGDERLFIVEQHGEIWIVEADGSVLPEPFLDIESRVDDGGNEKGLLGLTFHPNYSENGYFYVNYTSDTENGDTRISRFKVTNNPNVADPDSELNLMLIDQPFGNHNAGDLNFGHDGYLYFGMGDGGSGGDPFNYSQDPQSYLGKMLRLDVDSASPYAIPADNPFIGDASTLDEIWATGLRNPWRFSFDRLTGDMWIADVGQGVWEEVDVQPAASTGGENYGWRCYEGTEVYNDTGCGAASDYVDPVFQYDHSANGGFSITGGYVYRGIESQDLTGYYVCCDYVSGHFWTVNAESGNWETQFYQNFQNDISTFGEDQNGEIYLANLSSGDIYKLIDEDCAALQVSFTKTNASCAENANGTIDVFIAGENGSISSIVWSHDAMETNLNLDNLSAGNYTLTIGDEANCFKQISFEIVADAGPEATASVDIDTVCSDTEVTLSASGGASYSWSPSAGLSDPNIANPTANIVETIEYTVIVTDDSNCSSQASVTITAYPVTALQISLDGLTLTSDVMDANSYQWYKDDTQIDGATSSSFEVDETGDYYLQISDANDCSITSNIINVFVDDISVLTSSTLDIYPNPTQDLLYLNNRLELDVEIMISITNLQGKELIKQAYSKAGIDVHALSEGIYFLNLEIGEQYLSQKFSVIR